MTSSASAPESFQIPIEAAELYEAAFVPAFFAQWAPILCGAARVSPGHAVLDVGCGTGVVARTAAALVEPGGRVVGVDLNEAMLTVARRVRPDLEWRRGEASQLPLDDQSFDVVLSQMALMFFPEPASAIAEMARVARPDGTIAVLVPARLDLQEAFAPFVEMAVRRAGPEAKSLLTTYFSRGDLDELSEMFERAGLSVDSGRVEHGTYRANSVDDFVTTEVESTPLVERMTEGAYRRLRADAHTVLAPFTIDDGRVEAPFAVNVVVATP
jgi:ubiquinone/menaquinone biosynthesis C-methylase UbiE